MIVESSPARKRLRQIFLSIFILAISWAVVVRLTGGGRFWIGTFRVSSRSPVNALIAAMLSAVAAWALASSQERRQILPTLLSQLRRCLDRVRTSADSWVGASIPPAIAAVFALIVLLSALAKSTYVASGADAYGYMSQADLWVKRDLIVKQPLTTGMDWPNVGETLTPLGYMPRGRGTDMVPIYAPGLPMLMAAFKIIAGPTAVFWVVPCLGAVTIWATYLMGSRLASPVVGTAGAALMASSPAFLMQLMFPMSDVPVTAWWTLSLAFLLFEHPWAPFAAGLTAGAAVLTRPNLIPLAAVLGIFLVWRAARCYGRDERSVTQRALLFAAGSVPACAIVAIINTQLYGSPFRSGYGRLSNLYRWHYLSTNLIHYAGWLLQTQTAVIALALSAPFVLRRQPLRLMGDRVQTVVLLWLCFAAVVFLSYMFYVPFGEWWYLRFVLPAFPPLFVLTSSVILAIIDRTMRRGGTLMMTIVIGILAWHGVTVARHKS